MESPIVVLPALPNVTPVPEGIVFVVRYSLTAQPAPAPVASTTSRTGLVPLLHAVAPLLAPHEVSDVADALSHWSNPVWTMSQNRLGEATRPSVPALTVSEADTVQLDDAVVVEQAAAHAGPARAAGARVTQTAISPASAARCTRRRRGKDGTGNGAAGSQPAPKLDEHTCHVSAQ
jgi:hypothetical protein